MADTLIVDLCPYWVNPTTGGGPERVFHLCEALSGIDNLKQISFRPTVTMLRLRSTPIKKKNVSVSHRYEETQLLHIPSMLSSWLVSPRLMPSDFLMGTTARLLDGSVTRKTIQSADLLQVEHPWLYGYAKKRASSNAKIVLSTHNCEYWLHHQTASRIGNSRFSLEVVKQAERHALDNADLVLAVSTDDLMSFSRELDVDVTHKAEIVPNGVDTSATRPATPNERAAAKQSLGISSEFLAVFMGSRHGPNVEAVSTLARLAKRHDKQDLKIIVIGSAGEGFHNVGNVSFTGHVEDYRPYLRAADVALNPLTSGSGTSLKVLEYLAAGIPVISTSLGVRGLKIENGRHVLVSDNSSLAENIDLIASDQDLTRTLSFHGRRLAVEAYDWRIIEEEFVNALRRRGLT